ncbi:LysR family transcriptional regulator [Aquamicrobium sp. LC103]|uniref:LysR family transcriptional regulator n=1 Tax=Aquamicrobium sp. LC103 TaxID=1120658 RepID=UPI00063EA029|nr:LysR family transcriptional regulator [Aquamicrobium sp. LC103]TKT75777.1 LysR family transcriptional regulator [Aquamicrobium sp. LC103]
MDLRLLEYFLRVAEFGSMNRAAADLNLSQPSLSRKIALLEEEIGAPLFSRDTTGTKLTEAGLLLAGRAPQLLREVMLVKEEIAQERSTSVSLALPSSLNRLLAIPFLEKVAREHPLYTLRVTEIVSNALEVWMQRRTLDVAITALQPRTQRFTMTPLIREPMMLVGAANKDLDLAGLVSPDFVARHKLVLPETGNPIRRYLEQKLGAGNLSISTVVEVESVALCYELARAGVGYTMLPYSSIYEHRRDDEVSMAAIQGFEVTWALAVNRYRVHSAAVSQVAEDLLVFARERAADERWKFAETI